MGLGQGYCALGSVFCLCFWAQLVYPLYFVRNRTSRHYCPSRNFVLGWTTLGDLPYYMGIAMEKGAQSCLGQVLAAGGTQVTAGGTKVSTGGTKVSTGGTQVAHGWDVGGTLSRLARPLEASIRRR